MTEQEKPTSSGNHIYFYSDVTEESVVTLLTSLREKRSLLLAETSAREIKRATPIWIHINSDGGSLFSGFGAADVIESLQYPVYSIVEGVVASAATLISIACTKRFILPNSYMILHAPSTWMEGTYHEFQDENRRQQEVMKRVIKYYKKRTALTKEKLNVKLKKDWWLNAKTAKKWGLVDTIYG